MNLWELVGKLLEEYILLRAAVKALGHTSVDLVLVGTDSVTGIEIDRKTIVKSLSVL